MSTIRIAITGAAGQIGYSLLPRIAAGEMFGPNSKIILQLLMRSILFELFVQVIQSTHLKPYNLIP